MADKQKSGATRTLNLGEPYTRFGLFRRSPRVSADWFRRHWFQRHWLGLILLAQLSLTTVFIVFAATYGFTESTIFFGALAGYNLVALLFRLFFADHRRIRQLTDNA